MLLVRLKGEYKNHQYYTYQIIKADFIYMQILEKVTIGNVWYQIQNGKPKLIVYVTKRLPEAAQIYSITKLELFGLAIKIACFAHLLKKVDFDAIVDNLALPHIVKSKEEPASNKTKRLLKVLISSSFNLYYIEGKDMILSGFLY